MNRNHLIAELHRAAQNARTAPDADRLRWWQEYARHIIAKLQEQHYGQANH